MKDQHFDPFTKLLYLCVTLELHLLWRLLNFLADWVYMHVRFILMLVYVVTFSYLFYNQVKS